VLTYYNPDIIIIISLKIICTALGVFSVVTTTQWKNRVMVFNATLKQYFSYIMAVSFIGVGEYHQPTTSD
jgi:LPS O-antigen subunit length determinant protein (WzzB/FepE family)